MALPWPEASAKLPCSWTLMAAWPRWFLFWHRCSTSNRTLAPSIAGRMSWDYWTHPVVSRYPLCTVALASKLLWQCCEWCPPCSPSTSQPNISFATARRWSCPMPWGNCWSWTSTPLKVKSKMKTSPTLCLGGLGCMASSTLYHTLSWLHCCHTIPAAAEMRVPGKNPHRRYMIATLGSVAVTIPGKLPSCSVSQSAYRRWESCSVPEFQASAKQCGGMQLCFFPKTFENPKFHNF